ncbi:hypothetical protein [Moraxella bovis]|uniref:Uncharacterized protein n=2 Tax=Moraxella bovis TaxID=476 RepID=A0A378PXL3_MORBO|nr:hypothetical protein [Moraxella bovis]STY93026.1 Uncharacterised protein [Moraxella bovis]
MKNETSTELYEKMGKVSFENAVRTDELPPHIQLALKNRPKTQEIPNENPPMIEPDVWQLIKANANNQKEMARMNAVPRGLFA